MFIVTNLGLANLKMMEYQISTSNIFGALSSTQGGYEQSNTQQTAQERELKRKRYNTGNSFDQMNSDDKMKTMFEHLMLIEQSQDEIKTLCNRLNSTDMKVKAAEMNIEANTYKIQQLAYRIIELEANNRQDNFLLYNLEDNETCENELISTLKSFLNNELEISDDEIYIRYARRIGVRDRNSKFRRPVIGTLGHFCEVDIVMQNARKLKGSRYSVDRDYPKEIRDARRKLWPRIKEIRRSQPEARVQLKYPAKIEVNGRIIEDEFPYWAECMKGPATRVFNNQKGKINIPEESNVITSGAAAHFRSNDTQGNFQ